jgi:monofunctional biosynthetic peptidoglycan transglycosylase
MPSAAQKSRPWRLPEFGWRRAIAVLIVVVVVLIALPYLIVPFYRVINPVSTLMLWRFATGQRVERTWVPLDRIAPILPLTVILSEDGTFCHNRGVDFGAMREAIEKSGDDIAGARGASTITQQTAKNLFLWGGRSFVRKALELPLALWLNMVLPKRRVMEIYLNIVQWGPNGEFGAEAASHYAFNKPARNLNGHEAAELAAILPAPARRSARTPGPQVRRLADVYERRAADFPGHDACVRPPNKAP